MNPIFLNSPSGQIHMKPMDEISGFQVRPGFYELNGAMAIPGGVNFTVHSTGAVSCELLLFHRAENTPYAAIPFPERYRIGDVYSMIVFGLDIKDFEYAYRLDGPYDKEKGLLFDKKNILLDIYAKAVTGQSVWGVPKKKDVFYKARVVQDNFDWGAEPFPQIPMEDLVIYEMHVRGFTKHESSGVSCPGTFSGIMEKIPYLKAVSYTHLPILGVENPRHFFACYRKDLYLTKYMRYFLELLHEVRNLPAGRHGQTPGAEAQSLIGIPTELPQMLNAREQRAALQNRLLGSCRCPLVSFTLNIPGPVKVLPLVPQAFDAGISKIEDALADPVSYTHLDVYKRQLKIPITRGR